MCTLCRVLHGRNSVFLSKLREFIVYQFSLVHIRLSILVGLIHCSGCGNSGVDCRGDDGVVVVVVAV